MDRREFLAGATSLVGASLLRAQPATSKRPRIVLIRTDDQDLRSVRQTLPDGRPLMRNVLALMPLEFETCVVSTPICTPSRVSVYTGQYAHNHGIVNNDMDWGGVGSLAEWLQSSGYTTVHIGKYLNTYASTDVPPGWSEWYTTYPSWYFGYAMNVNGTLISYGSSPADYHADVVTARAVEVLQRVSGPLLLVVDYHACHKTAPPVPNVGHLPVPAPRHAGLLDAWFPAWSPSFNEADVSDKPAYVSSSPRLSHATIEKVLELMRRRNETLMSVDEGIATILGSCGSEDVVFFTSDNGFHQGEHRLDTGKGTPYEEAIRVPLFASGLGAGVVSDVVANVDLTATICGLAGATPTRIQDGLNLLQPLARAGVLLEGYKPDESRWYCGVRRAGETFVRHETGEEERYDLALDPYQLEARAGTPELRQLVRRLKNCAGAACA